MLPIVKKLSPPILVAPGTFLPQGSASRFLAAGKTAVTSHLAVYGRVLADDGGKILGSFTHNKG